MRAWDTLFYLLGFMCPPPWYTLLYNFTACMTQTLSVSSHFRVPKMASVRYSEDSIIKQTENIAKFLITDIIGQAKEPGLPETLVPPQQPSELHKDIGRLCTELREENEEFVEKLRSVKINFENAESDFMLFIKAAFDRRKISWSAVYGVLMVASALGGFLMEKGHFFRMIVVPKIATWVRMYFVDAGYITWIREQGGWVSST